MFKQFFVKTNFVVLSILVGLCISIGIQGVSGPLTASGAAPACENAVCVPAGESAQWRSGNLVLNTSFKYEMGLSVPYGNIGIGTPTPNARLDVVGNTLFAGKVLVGVGSVTENKQVLTVQGNTESQGLCIGGDCITSWSGPKERLQSTGTSSGSSSSGGSSSGSSSGGSGSGSSSGSSSGGSTTPAFSGTCPGFSNTVYMKYPIPYWNGSNSRMYTKDHGGVGPNSVIVVEFTIPADAKLTPSDGSGLASISGAEYIDNGTPRVSVLSTKPCDFSGTDLGQGSNSEGTSVSASFSIGYQRTVKYVGYLSWSPPYIKPGQTVYFNVKNADGGGGCEYTGGSCNMFFSIGNIPRTSGTSTTTPTSKAPAFPWDIYGKKVNSLSEAYTATDRHCLDVTSKSTGATWSEGFDNLGGSFGPCASATAP